MDDKNNLVIYIEEKTRERLLLLEKELEEWFLERGFEFDERYKQQALRGILTACSLSLKRGLK